jgi:O-antigen/teichoic acid export membrane protein
VSGDTTDLATPSDPADARLADALERVAHGAVVSVPSVLLEQALLLAFTASLTNGFGAAAYGVFVVARRFQAFLLSLSMGVRGGVSRFLPNADTEAERDVVATYGTALQVGVATCFGAGLYLAAPALAGLTPGVTAGPAGTATFVEFLRVFALGLPAVVWFFAVVTVLRGLEEVGALNLLQRVAFPLAQLGIAVLGVLLFDRLVGVAVGVVVLAAVLGTAGAVWLVAARGLRPRLRGPGAREVRRRYLRFVAPLFAASFPTTIQRLGFYPLVALFLGGTAGGIFAVGVLVGGLVRLPLVGINQFVPPVAAALHEEGHREALSRFYHVSSRLVLVGTTALAVPAVVFRRPVMGLFGEAFLAAAWLLPGFVVAQFAACAAGSVGILLTMTDNQRALLVVNTVVTLVLVVVSIPLTVEFGLPGLVATYLLMLTLNNGLEVLVLYRAEGLQPFTRAHLRPLLAAVPFAGVALAVQSFVPSPALAAVVGTTAGLAAYALVLRRLGSEPAERRLVGTLVGRYRRALPGPLSPQS